MKILSLFMLVVLFLSGCASVVEPYDYSALRKNEPRSILVIPPLNNSVEVNAPYSYLSTISKPLAEKGYYVFPVSVVDAFFKENGLPTPGEMNNIPLNKVDEIIGADAVLYVNLDEWGQSYNVISSITTVKGVIRLVAVKTGELLWEAPIFAQYDPNANNQHGLVGALVGAIVSQIAGEITDYSPQVARTANANAINSAKRGLLYGPYKVLSEKEAVAEQNKQSN